MPRNIQARKVSVVFDSPWFRLEEIEIGASLDDSQTELRAEQYYRLVEPQGVICVLLSPQGDFLLVRQPRPPIGEYTVEFPAGRIDDTETPIEAVRREVFEEVGVTLSEVYSVGVVQPVPSRLYSLQTLFIGISSSEPPEESTEQNMSPMLVPRDQLLSVLMEEGIHCVVALGAIKLAELKCSIDIFKDSMDVIRQRLSTATIDG